MAVSTLTIQTPRAFKVREAAEQLGVGPTTIRKLIDRGELGAVRIGADLRVPADAVTAFLQSHLLHASRQDSAQLIHRRARRA